MKKATFFLLALSAYQVHSQCPVISSNGKAVRQSDGIGYVVYSSDGDCLTKGEPETAPYVEPVKV